MLESERRGRAARRAGIVLAALVAAGAATRAGDGEKRSLERKLDPVVLHGVELPRLKGVLASKLRLFSMKDGAFEPRPFQVDERTPELEYCWTNGPEPVKDVDGGRLDDDDEVVFLARDAGDRATSFPEGVTAKHEIELADARTGSKAWAYLLAFDEKVPAPSTVRYVEANIPRVGPATFETAAFAIACPGSPAGTGRPTDVRLRGPDGKLGPIVVRDAAKAHLRASYLFVKLDRDGSEARTVLGSSFISGPVRAVVPISVEVYVIWGNWITTTRSVVRVYEHAWELDARVSVPLNLDPSEPSEAQLLVALAPGLEGWRVANPYNADRPIEADGLDARLPSWNLLHGPVPGKVSGPQGAVLARLQAGALSSGRLVHGRDGTGFGIDLTGLRKGEYTIRYSLHFLPDWKPHDERGNIIIDDEPLTRSVR